MSEVVICNGPECGRPATSKGYCTSHYAQFKRTGKVWPLRKQVNSLNDDELVERKATAKPGRPATPRGKCRLDFCDRPVKVVSLELCAGHYQQQWNGNDLTPIRPIAEAQPTDASKRKCNTCHRVKDRDDFYTRSNGNPQTECKQCMGHRSRIGFLKRKGRTPEAQALQAAWDEYVEGAPDAQNGV